MTEVKQLRLFDLAPRNAGQIPTSQEESGLASISIRRFKGIENMEVEFDPITLLVGGNNSGKSTVLQAIRLFYYCIAKCGTPSGDGTVTIRKHVMPFSEFALIPAHDIKELVTGGVTPNTTRRGIYLKGCLRSGQSFDFTIYAAYSTLMVIAPGSVSPSKISREEFDRYRREPLYVPGFFGVVTKELLATNRRLEALLTSGHHNEVLRNLVLRLRSVPDTLTYLEKMLQEQFGVTFRGVSENPDAPDASEYLRASYAETGIRIPLDVISAGSGFLQVLQFLTHALQSPSPILLLDEPDAHMHVRLQERFISLLRRFARERQMQVVMASHSETFLRETSLEEIRLVDRKLKRADRFRDPVRLQAELNTQGIWPDHPELTEALRIKRVLLCESRADAELLASFGKAKYPSWGLAENMFQVIETEGSSQSIVNRVEFVVKVLDKLLNGNVRAACLRDRDLMCDEYVEIMQREAREKGLHLFITSRRNRESYLVDPKVIEVVFEDYKDKLPEEWRKKGAIQALVTQWCTDFCSQQLDELPVKVREYNTKWIRATFPEDEAQRSALARLDGFIRKSWYEPLQSKVVPWSLMDGRGALKYVRDRLAEKSIMLPDKLLLDHVTALDTPTEFSGLVDVMHAWTSTVSSSRAKR